MNGIFKYADGRPVQEDHWWKLMGERGLSQRRAKLVKCFLAYWREKFSTEWVVDQLTLRIFLSLRFAVFYLYLFIYFLIIFYLFMIVTHTHTERERERERERGRDTGRGRSRLHAPGARRGIRSRVSRIAPWAKGRRQTTAPPRDPLQFFIN